ncbi:Uncharacterised protein [Mycobacteroides abscessus subsp. abscessus]|nr:MULTISPECIES: hypothetical protein [Mycobacteroides]MCV7306684.1 hypothetical protein [Mycobacteroides immunogenum]SID66940.1 Uncharacterised protein [Mycobacteroides abscessus subsp. abscessus]SIF70488.1 Uncharacterised protein [Mycobacteroides abscessus subsp. abscessus]SIF74933.1 Uncharacterised protein [Mycobacteroides abscessus subsp. abscessus]SIF78532.1 Uncharacterised protein [Mycobacteroides abscessus subsp. abscessus]
MTENDVEDTTRRQCRWCRVWLDTEDDEDRERWYGAKDFCSDECAEKAQESLTERVERLIEEFQERGTARASYEHDEAEVEAEVIEEFAIVQISVRRDAECDFCRQRTRIGGPVVHFDRDGDEEGGYGHHQHGCGHWNVPACDYIRSRDEGEIRALIERVIDANNADVISELRRWWDECDPEEKEGCEFEDLVM